MYDYKHLTYPQSFLGGDIYFKNKLSSLSNLSTQICNSWGLGSFLMYCKLTYNLCILSAIFFPYYLLFILILSISFLLFHCNQSHGYQSTLIEESSSSTITPWSAKDDANKSTTQKVN